MAIIGFIVLGDRTSHGGKVLECKSRRSIDGLAIAMLGDLVSCPRCKRVTRIITSRFPQVKENGIPTAFDLDMTDCGALLYSRHNNHAGYGSDVPPSSASRSATAAKTTMEATASRSWDAPSVQEHFILHDRATGEGFSNLGYTLQAADGRAIEGETDEHGRTDVVWTVSPADTHLLLKTTADELDDPYHFPESISGEI